MVFNSLTFLVFLAVVLAIYYRLQHRGQNVLLLAASYVFYGWWDWRCLGLLVFTSLFDYFCALKMEEQATPVRRKFVLSLSLITNLGVLGVFKYFNFFADSLIHVLAAFGMKADLPVIHIILPLGISFYTFLSMSYTIDVYRNELKASRNPTDFLLYVAFFPHLVAGPIVRASYLLPQCQRPRTIIPDQVANGIWLILVGYVKKIVIADRMAGMVEWGFHSDKCVFGDANVWLVIYACAFQIYGDFSGYSDIARGLSKVMGFELPVNFKAPFLVTNPRAFWQNWHISLSAWLRDYLFIPLGGYRRGIAHTCRNLMITMLLAGLWHGAGMAYLAMGLFHGLVLVIPLLWRNRMSIIRGKREKRKSPASGRWREAANWFQHAGLVVFFFHVTCIGALLFRLGAVPEGVSSLQLGSSMLNSMLHWPTDLSPLVQPVALLGTLALVLQAGHESMDNFSAWKTKWQAAAVIFALSAIAMLGTFKGTQFVYFQF